MNCVKKLLPAVAVAGCVWIGDNTVSNAQSGTRQPRYAPRSAPGRSYAPAQPRAGSGSRSTTPPAGSGTRSQNPSAPQLALGGRCAVCLVDGKTWATGTPEHSVVFDGCEYRFPGAGEKDMFLSNPDRYAPALNGNSVVAYAQTGKLVPGSTKFGLFYNGRVYLLQNAQEQQQFQTNPRAYADADLAYRGQSVVSLVDGRQRVAGSPQFATRHGGFRFLFTSAAQRDAFLANPTRYVQSN